MTKSLVKAIATTFIRAFGVILASSVKIFLGLTRPLKSKVGFKTFKEFRIAYYYLYSLRAIISQGEIIQNAKRPSKSVDL